MIVDIQTKKPILPFDSHYKRNIILKVPIPTIDSDVVPERVDIPCIALFRSVPCPVNALEDSVRVCRHDNKTKRNTTYC